MLSRLSELGLLAAIHSDLPDPRHTPGLEARLARALFTPPPPAWDLADTIAGLSRPAALTYLVWLAGLPAETAGAVAQRLRLPGALIEMLSAAARLREVLPTLDPAERPSRLVARFDPIPRPALYALYLLQEPAPAASLLNAYAETWRHIMPVTNGESVRAAGLPPGPVYRQLLSRLRAAWLDGELNELADEERLFEKLLREYTAGSIQPTQEAQ
jgi:tRNA nucleotidyltransferase (CCA-adding enzyme)